MADDLRRVQFGPKDSGQVCAGPNHGNPDALPAGDRRWQAGLVLALTQHVEGELCYNVFCSDKCLCDWHGRIAAAVESAETKADEDLDLDPPGVFTLVWVTPSSLSMGTYDDWDALTKVIGTYQMALIERGMV